MLIPTVAEIAAGNLADRARLDVSARGLWSGYERTFVDIRVTHPTANTNMTKSLEAVYISQEKEKKRAYNRRVIDVEKGTFTPLVFTRLVGWVQSVIGSTRGW